MWIQKTLGKIPSRRISFLPFLVWLNCNIIRFILKKLMLIGIIILIGLDGQGVIIFEDCYPAEILFLLEMHYMC